ncbi:hypothetical protein U9M48_006814 [Paspalum notatum var. saurae]|uniref:Lipoxygenase domain-containing protein n=1 Tax=Paspalum notatum var. saurae TaxID=547442 RepID=A0AAQ3Q0I4_PASNO
MSSDSCAFMSQEFVLQCSYFDSTEDKFAWLRDDEFARQTVVGINPVSIARLTVFPPVSKLDPAIYGPPESSITEAHISGNGRGKAVHMELDYHDVYLPFLDRINAIDGRKAYATRTILFLTKAGTLKPVAIVNRCQFMNNMTHEILTRTLSDKTLFLAEDACYNGIVHLGGASANERNAPNLQAPPPPYDMLYTPEINALARQSLINADGVIESCFTPGPVSFEISAAYILPQPLAV